MNILKHYELVTYFVPLLGSLSGARKSCFQFWQTSNSPPLRSLIITIPIIVTTPSTGVPQISNWPTPDAFKLPFKYFPCKFKLRNIPIIFREYCNFILGRGMKPLHWRPSHSTFHLLNWSLERSFGGYLVQICSGWGRGRKSPGLVSSISIPATSSWWWGRGAAGERGVVLTKNKWEQIDFREELTIAINVVN